MKKIYILTLGLFCSWVSISYSQWAIQTTGASQPSRGVVNISITDANTAWISMFDGKAVVAPAQPLPLREFSKTTNGGATWTAGTISAAASGMQISQIAGVSATVAYAALADPANVGGAIFKTVDGGSTWTSSISMTAAGYPDVVYFWDANTGVAMGDPRVFITGKPSMFEIYTTTNGGTAWDKKESPVPNATDEYGIPSVMAVNGNHIWFGTTKGRVYHSADKGNTWAVGTTGGTGPVFSLAFQDANTGFAIVGTSFYKTTNGGTAWSPFTPVSGAPFPTAITYVPGTTSTYFSVGVSSTNPGSSYSIDGGNNWVGVDNIQHTALAFFDSKTGWSGGFSQATGTGTINGVFKWVGSTVGVLENSSNVLFSLFPNPTNEALNLRLEGNSFGENLQVDIIDIIGNKVISERLISSNSPITLNISNLSGGTYFIKVNNGSQERTEKFVKF